MVKFISFLIKSRDNAEVVKDEEDTKEEEKEES